MTNSSTDIVQVARSRENFDDLLEIDLTIFETPDALEILEGHKPHDHEENSKKSGFHSASFRKKHALITLVVIFALIIVPTYSDQLFRSSAFAHGVSVGGVNIGGKSTSEAIKALKQESKKALETPMLFTFGKEQVSISSQDLDLSYDIDASIAQAKNLGTDLDPISAIVSFARRYTVGHDINPVVKYDRTKFDNIAESLVNSFSKGRTNAAVEISGTTVKVLKPKSGQGVSKNQAKSALFESVQDFSRSEIKLKSEKVNAQISLAEAEKTAAILRVMFKETSTLTTPGGNSITIAPEQLSNAILVKPVKSSLTISIDDEKMRATLADQLKDVEVAPIDASFSVSGSNVSVIPSVPGKRLDFASAVPKWIKGEHKFTIGVIDVQPARDTNWATKLNITEPVSSFSTNFTAGQIRVKNIRRAAEQVNNTVLAPGETFSLNEKLGKRTEENGYFKAPVFSDIDGFYEDYGGGASQFSTTLFNAAFIGGYKDIAHVPHSIYISRYPMGREATLNWGSIDMSFKNDSNSGILIRTSVGSSSVSVTLYGNKEGRTVKLEGPVELARTPIETEYTDDPSLDVGIERQVQGGYPGIVVENYRTVDRPGKPGKKERYRWTYNMVPRKVIRGTKPVATT